MGSNRGPKFAQWVPTPAHARIMEKLAEPDLAPQTQALCFRLAEFQGMRSVWESLPEWIGKENFISDVIVRYEIAIRLPPPFPRKRTDLEKYLKQYRSSASAELIALKARMMLDEMQERQDDARFCWERLWPSEREMTFDKLTATIKHTAEFYENIAAERQKAIADLALPPTPHKRAAKHARETWFSRMMSNYFAAGIGRPLDAVVEVLTDVAFDRKGELTPGIAKGRRLSAGKHYRKKPK